MKMTLFIIFIILFSDLKKSNAISWFSRNKPPHQEESEPPLTPDESFATAKLNRLKSLKNELHRLNNIHNQYNFLHVVSNSEFADLIFNPTKLRYFLDYWDMLGSDLSQEDEALTLEIIVLVNQIRHKLRGDFRSEIHQTESSFANACNQLW